MAGKGFFNSIKIVYYFPSVGTEQEREVKKICIPRKNCHGPGSDFTIEFFSVFVLRREGRQGRGH